MNTENEKVVRDPITEALIEAKAELEFHGVGNCRAVWLIDAALQSQVSNTPQDGCAPWLDLDEMVNRFLGWKLPEDFYPDAGISFNPTELQKSGVHPWPSGTNLLHAGQARAMLEYVLQGQPMAFELAAASLDSVHAKFLSEYSESGSPQAIREGAAKSSAVRSCQAHIRATASQESSSPLGRDADWTLAMAQALGTNSGYSVPIVPDVEAFRKLFDAVRASQESAPEQEAVHQFRPDGDNWIDCSDVFYNEWKGKKRIVYLATPTSTAIAELAIKQAAEACEKVRQQSDNIKQSETCSAIKTLILALTPAAAEAELEALMMKVAEEVFNSAGSFLTEDEELRAIVRRVLDEKGE